MKPPKKQVKPIVQRAHQESQFVDLLYKSCTTLIGRPFKHDTILIAFLYYSIPAVPPQPGGNGTRPPTQEPYCQTSGWLLTLHLPAMFFWGFPQSAAIDGAIAVECSTGLMVTTGHRCPSRS